jgi:Fic family protein
MPAWNVNFNVRVNTNNQEIVTLLARCRALASVINQIPITPSRQHRIDALNILRAVRGTTGIEGAELTEEEVQLILESPQNKAVLPPSRRREELEARNARKLMAYVARLLDRNPECPLTESLVSKLHEITTRNIDYPNKTPGKYRSFAVSAGNYVPPRSGSEVQQLMRHFIDWFNLGPPSEWDAIIGAIMAHFYVISIHPFADGNGRTSRAVESFLLYRAGINARGFYSLSNYYYRHRQDYVQHLDHVRFETNGDLTPFVLFALRGLVAELEEVHKEVLYEVREIAFRDFAREKLHESLFTKAGERMLRFIIILGNESVPLKAIRRGEHPLARLYHGLTAKTLSRDINYLEDEELIIVEEGKVQANFEIMGKFVPPYELIR